MTTRSKSNTPAAMELPEVANFADGEDIVQEITGQQVHGGWDAKPTCLISARTLDSLTVTLTITIVLISSEIYLRFLQKKPVIPTTN
jgi:hypothetical protein